MFFLLLWTNGAYNASIRYNTTVGHVAFLDEENGVGASWHAGTDALSKTADLIGEGFDPNNFSFSFAQMTVFLGLAGGWINDSVSLMLSRFFPVGYLVRSRASLFAMVDLLL